MENKPLFRIAFLGMAGAFLLSVPAQAQLLNVNLNGGSTIMTGAAVLGSSGDSWNNINPANGVATALTYAGTAATPMPTLTVANIDNSTTGVLDYFSGVGQVGPAPALLSAGIYSFTATHTPTFTLNGLLANQNYQLELYASNAGQSVPMDYPHPAGSVAGFVGSRRAVTFTVPTSYTYPLNVATPDATVSGTAATDFVYSTFAGAEGQIYVSLVGKTDADGTLVISASGLGNLAGGFVDIMGFQAEAIPEPSTWAMMLVGLVSLVGLQRFVRKV